jgi:hypothetical protein
MFHNLMCFTNLVRIILITVKGFDAFHCMDLVRIRLITVHRGCNFFVWIWCYPVSPV